jgi:hypothetical protein
MKTAFNKQLKNFNKARKGKEMISARAKKFFHNFLYEDGLDQAQT